MTDGSSDQFSDYDEVLLGMTLSRVTARIVYVVLPPGGGVLVKGKRHIDTMMCRHLCANSPCIVLQRVIASTDIQEAVVARVATS